MRLTLGILVRAIDIVAADNNGG
jgi:hypothetical protein